MTDAIIVVVLIVVLLIGIRYSIKHFKGEGGCCGGGSTVKVKKKKLDNVIAVKKVVIEGMSCENCKNRVERCLNDLDGVAAKVNLKKKTAVVSMEKDVSDEQITKAITDAGYTVVDIN